MMKLILSVGLFVLLMGASAQAQDVTMEQKLILQQHMGVALDSDFYDQIKNVDSTSNNSQRPSAAQAAAFDPNAAAEILAQTEFDPSQASSLMFTFWEHQEIIRARNSIGREIANVSGGGPVSELIPEPLPEERFIHLQGILYTSADDWVVWLNGQQVRPNALPKEAIKFEVFKDHVEIEWFDNYTRQIIPLRMRPLQRFNIDSRLFLPG